MQVGNDVEKDFDWRTPNNGREPFLLMILKVLNGILLLTVLIETKISFMT
jgi:hypothetical protein